MKKIFIAFVLVFLISVNLTSCGLTVPRPEVKQGEFNFSVTYEFNEETKTVSGVYVCEYSGTDWALDGGSHRDWNGYIKGGEIEEAEARYADQSAAKKDEAYLSREHKAYADRPAPGSISFVPSVMGLILAGEVIKDIALG